MYNWKGKAYKEEVNINKIASDNGISPRFIFACQSYDFPSFWEIETERYPLTLEQIPIKQRSRYYPLLFQLLNRLHNLGIIHGDIKSRNIVINPQTDDAKFIDYGSSIFIKDLTPKRLEEYCENSDIENCSIDEILNSELTELKNICGY